MGNEEAGSLKAQGGAIRLCCGHAGDLGFTGAGIGYGKLHGVSVDESDGGSLPVGKLDCQTQPKPSPGQPQLMLPHFVKEPRSVAQDHRNGRNRIPDDVAKTAKASEVGIDLVPVRVQRHILRRADSQETLRVGGNSAGVRDVELEGRAGRERRGERNGGLVKLAGVIGVRIEDGDREGYVFAGDQDALPIELRGDLQRNAGQRRFAVIADGQERAYCHLAGRRPQMHVEVEICVSHGLAFVVGGYRCRNHLDIGIGCRSRLGGGLAVLVDGAREDHLRWGQRRLRRGLWLGRGRGRVLRRLGVRLLREQNERGGETNSQRSRCQQREFHDPRPFCLTGLDALPARAEAPAFERFAARRWRNAS